MLEIGSDSSSGETRTPKVSDEIPESLSCILSDGTLSCHGRGEGVGGGGVANQLINFVPLKRSKFLVCCCLDIVRCLSVEKCVAGQICLEQDFRKHWNVPYTGNPSPS